MIRFTRNLAFKAKMASMNINKATLQGCILANQGRHLIRNNLKSITRSNISRIKNTNMAIMNKNQVLKSNLNNLRSRVPKSSIFKTAPRSGLMGLNKRMTARNFSFFSQQKNKFVRFLQTLRYPLYYYMIGINTAVYLMFQIPVFNNLFLSKWLALSQWGMSTGKIWTLFSYGFVHSSFLHFLMNMVTFFFFGR